MGILNYQHVISQTKNPPLIILHSTPLDHSYLQKSLGKIELDRDIYLIDLPNHGGSTDLPVENLNFENIADEIKKFISEKELGLISLYGHGVGGFVALHFAIKFESKIQSLIISNSAPNSNYRKEMAWNIRDKYSKVTIQSLSEYAGRTDEKSVRVRFTQSLAVHFEPKSHELAKALLDSCSRIASDAYVYLSQILIPKYDVRDEIRKLKVKTLILGGKDDVWPQTAHQFLENDIPHARSLRLDGGHFPMIDHPKLYWSTIKLWLNDELP